MTTTTTIEVDVAELLGIDHMRDAFKTLVENDWSNAANGLFADCLVRLQVAHRANGHDGDCEAQLLMAKWMLRTAKDATNSIKSEALETILKNWLSAMPARERRHWKVTFADVLAAQPAA